jgi:hypothetical protein
MREPRGLVRLANLLDTVNSLPLPERAAVVAALKLHDPGNSYFTQSDGRIEAERVR